MTDIAILAQEKVPFSESLGNAFDGYGIIGFLVTGIVLGVVAKLLIPGKQAIPFWLTILCGIAGAGIGNILAAVIGVDDTGGIDWLRHGLQILGAIVVVIVISGLWAKIRGGSRAKA